MLPQTIERAVALRHTLHRVPELSNVEHRTAQTIVDFLQTWQPDGVFRGLGGTGVAAIYKGIASGPTVLFRCELDALPIAEVNTFAHRSSVDHTSHKCGHDGHMAMVAGLAPMLVQRRPARGRVVLLFQPAEETGEGAAAVIKDAAFAQIAPDYAFAIHNIPGAPTGQVIVREGTFAMASVGMSCVLMGRTSHASEPERGVSPVRAVSALLSALAELANAGDYRGFTLVTLTHATIGERSYGISPGRAEILATLRAEHDSDLQLLRQRAMALVRQAAEQHQLTHEIAWSDYFAATVNDKDAVKLVMQSAQAHALTTFMPPQPVRWSEDFGLFTQRCKGALIGVGSGVDHPALHSPDYDFPDEIIPVGLKLFDGIVDAVCR